MMENRENYFAMDRPGLLLREKLFGLVMAGTSGAAVLARQPGPRFRARAVGRRHACVPGHGAAPVHAARQRAQCEELLRRQAGEVSAAG